MYLKRLLAIAVMFLPVPAWAAVAYEAQASAIVTDSTSLSSLTLTFTCTDNNTELFVAACIRETGASTLVNNITYNGLTFGNFTRVQEYTVPPVTGAVSLSVWRARPGAVCDGAGHTMLVSIVLAKEWSFGVMSFTGVDAGSPHDPPVFQVTDGVPAVNGQTGPIASETGDIVAGYLCRRGSSGTVTGIAGQTERYNRATGHTTTSSNVRYIAATETGTPTVDIGWDTFTVAQEWIALGFNINAVGVRRRTSPLRHYMQQFFATPAPIRAGWSQP